VYEFHFGNREGDPYAEDLSFWLLEEFLEEADVAPVRRGGGGEREVINV